MAKRGGRNSSLTADVLARLEAAFQVGATVTEACSHAEVSRDAFYRYCSRHPEFRDKVTRLRSRPMFTARTVLMKEIMNQNPVFAMKYLELEEKRAARREYSKRWRAELELKRNENVQQVEGLPPTPQEYARKLDDQFAFEEEPK